MKKKYLLIIIIAFFCFMPFINVQADTTDGWVKENGETYYYKNGEKVKGFQEIEGKTYFFSQVNNILKRGVQKLNNDINQMFYLNEDGTVYHGWKELDGETYYFGEDHFAVNGFREIEGKTYFFSQVNNALKRGVQKLNNDINQMFYLNEDGTVYHGWKELDGETYYFGENHFAVKGFQEIEGKTYFFSQVNNILKRGVQKLNNDINQMFYLNEDGTVYHGWKELDGETYYFGEDHFAVNGFQTIDNTNYYFNNYELQTGLVDADGKLIYTNGSGELQYGWQTINNNKYYFGEDGYAYNGFREIDGQTYFFSNINYVLKTGWQTLNNDYNQIFYLNMDGTVVYGNQTIEGRNYIFGEDGFLDGFKSTGNTFVYYNPDGTMAKGIQRMAGKYYQFNEYTGAFEKYVNQKIVIDVSAHQGNIDWEAVKNSGMVDAVILRAGYGVSWTDAYFQRNVQELNRLGIPYSVYLFSYAENANEARMEADNLINIIKNTGANIASDIFSIYYDLEDWTISSTGENSYGISQQTYQEMFNSFSSKVESALGVDVKIYASKNYIETRFPETLRPEIGWVAQWGPELTYNGTYEGWQYTSDGSVPGINGRVDMSIFYY